MPLIEYFLLALMGSGAAVPGAVSGTPPSAMLGADAIVQPNGGAMFASPADKHKRSGWDQRRKRRHKHSRIGSASSGKNYKPPRTPRHKHRWEVPPIPPKGMEVPKDKPTPRP